jgi:hypothetical protein
MTRKLRSFAAAGGVLVALFVGPALAQNPGGILQMFDFASLTSEKSGAAAL